jgi:hypothetical protein
MNNLGFATNRYYSKKTRGSCLAASPDQKSQVFRELEKTFSTGELIMAMRFSLQHELSWTKHDPAEQ